MPGRTGTARLQVSWCCQAPFGDLCRLFAEHQAATPEATRPVWTDPEDNDAREGGRAWTRRHC